MKKIPDASLNFYIKNRTRKQINIDSVRQCRGWANKLLETGTCTIVKFFKKGETVNVTWTKDSNGYLNRGGLYADSKTAFLGYRIN